MNGDVRIGEHEEQVLRRSLHAVARSTPVHDDFAGLLRRIEAEPARAAARPARWRLVAVAVAATVAVVVGVLVAGSGDDGVDTGPADTPPPTEDGAVAPTTTAVPSESTAPGGMVALLDPVPEGWTSSWTVNDDGPLDARLLRPERDPRGAGEPVVLLFVSRGPLDEGSETGGGTPARVGDTDVWVEELPEVAGSTATWNWRRPDGSEHRVQAIVPGSRSAEVVDVIATLVDDPLGDLADTGFVEVPYAIGDGPPGPSALYQDGGGGLRVDLYDVPIEEIAPDVGALEALMGQSVRAIDLRLAGIELEPGREGFALAPVDGGDAIVVVELPSGRVAVVQGGLAAALGAVEAIVEVPVDEAIERLEAGQAD